MKQTPIVFMGSAASSQVIFQALTGLPSVCPRGVVTAPDRPRRRGGRREPCVLKGAALAAGIPVLSPENINDPASLAALAAWEPRLIVVVAYGQFLGTTLLALPPSGCVNVHFSLLPALRGAAPAQWAILQGLSHTGVSIMRMDAGMDSGDLLAQEQLAIEPVETGASLLDRLSVLGADLLVRTLPPWLAGAIRPGPQDPAQATFAPRLRKSDGWVDWRLPAHEIERRVRGLLPWPVSFTTFCPETGTSPLRLQIRASAVVNRRATAAPGTIESWDAEGVCVATGSDTLRVLRVAPEGRKHMSGADFMRGFRMAPGCILGMEAA